MTFSLPRALVFLLIGLPVGFVLSALGFVSLGLEIAAPVIAPWALSLAVLTGVAAGFWKPPY
ncbi:MAG: hypothetical protein AAF687_03095 [Pseudomonadota bacterium]